jgi:hypothetical protein
MGTTKVERMDIDADESLLPNVFIVDQIEYGPDQKLGA